MSYFDRSKYPALILLRMADKSKADYMNPDGTFKGGWDGCMAYMTEHEGHSKESATKICGYIKGRKG